MLYPQTFQMPRPYAYLRLHHLSQQLSLNVNCSNQADSGTTSKIRVLTTNICLNRKFVVGGGRIMTSNYCGRSSLPSSESLLFQQNCSTTTLEKRRCPRGSWGVLCPGRGQPWVGMPQASLHPEHKSTPSWWLWKCDHPPTPPIPLTPSCLSWCEARWSRGSPPPAPSAGHGNYPK